MATGEAMNERGQKMGDSAAEKDVGKTSGSTRTRRLVFNTHTQ